MDSLKNLMNQYDVPTEPPEVSGIKKFVQDNFQASCQVAVRESVIIISVQSASLANTLQLRLTQLRQIIGADKRIIFRIQ